MNIIPFNGRNDRHPLSLREAVNQMFDESIWDPFSSFFDSQKLRTALPSTNISEDQDNIEIKLNIPGYDPESISADLNGHNLVIHAKSQEEAESENTEKTYYRKECSYGEFTRSFTLPKHTDLKDIKCNYKNGTLIVKVPKKEEEKNDYKKIDINFD